MKKISTLFIFLFSFNTFAIETCSRVAQVNYQQLLVDAGEHKKGEGLRFYLEKDPESEKLLNEYQEKSKPTILGASASTLGSLLILSGLIKTGENENSANTNRFLLAGSALIATSYLISKTIQFQNEKILEKAVNEYNKRNKPLIYFSPYQDSNSSGISFGVQKGF